MALRVSNSNPNSGDEPSFKNLSIFSGRPQNKTYRPGTPHGKGQTGLPGMLGLALGLGENYQRQGMNFVGELGNWLTGNKQPGQGQGWGDSVLGSSPFPAPAPAKGGLIRGAKSLTSRTAPEPQKDFDSTNLPSFLSSLMEALGYVDSSYEAPTISYDPLRNEARGRAGEYDARLNAMYNQLQGSIRDDGKGIQDSYQSAIDSTAQRALDTQANIQGASDVADSRNAEVLAALGLGEAQGNIIDEGRDLNTQTAANVADAAARGQISGDALTQNQQSAGAHNTNLVGAAGLEGNLQRSRVQSELAQLLAQYDMEEQQANQQAQMQAQQMRNNGLAQAIGLAGNLYSSDWDSQRYQDDLAKAMYEQQLMQQQGSQPSKFEQSMSILQQLMQSPQFADLDIEAILPYLTAAGSVGKLL